MTKSILPSLLQTKEQEILDEWIKEQLGSANRAFDSSTTAVLKKDSQEFLNEFKAALQTADLKDPSGPVWAKVRETLARVTKSRSLAGSSPSATAMFIFSLKSPLFSLLRKELEGQPDVLTDELWMVTILLDKLGLYTTEIYQKSREEIIKRQQEEMLELSTPVVKLWDGILALPMIGTLDSSRTQVVMETLLQRIVETGSEVAIIDITGVPTVDTLVAQHLLKTVTAARLMGADCIISGIRPQIASTIVHLGVELGDIITKASLADAFKVALSLRGKKLSNERSSEKAVNSIAKTQQSASLSH